MKANYDVVVIGGGPAGSSAAALTAQAGHRTLLIEREAMPRFHIGESLMPEVYWPLQRLGVLDRMESLGFQKKLSVQFVTNSGKESSPFYFKQHDPRDCSSTWQVERSQFDQMLFERAGELGADCYDQTRVLDVQIDDQDRATGVRVRDAQGQEHEIASQVVVDATGLQSLIANKLGLKVVNPDLKKAAIWGYWKDARRDDGENEGATIIMQTENKDSWFWFIPLSNGITSIGCVGNNDYMLKQGLKPEAKYEYELSICPGLQERLKDADFQGEIRVAKEFSYTTTRHAGQGWVLIGDAFGFIDPIYSSGVYFALETGVRAADAINEGFANGDLSANQLARWADDFKEGSSWIRKLVHAYYTNEFSFGRFMKAHPEHTGNLTDLLIGRIFHDQAGAIFDDMDGAIATAKRDAMSM
ncbi:Putative FAD-dependent oxidoreductase LodB [Rosistilla carotiformis]|uniref:FAD-dependent oxidoreductase LodB n=1 Tax=Rosistilla carotiformis TaxID=2528017 RepID=A0A518K1N0_9BACT|nr:NAD(P)/FAD-dependent oxidoreductase [Rosistilla carotiformis]QDV71713.1 Putative FAD-dependent oxidoreductase LodB [Rosistilla carotiformis]